MSMQWGHDIPKTRFFSPHSYKLFIEFTCLNLEREDKISDNSRKKLDENSTHPTFLRLHGRRKNCPII